MRIYDLKVNRLENPMGYLLEKPRFSYKVDGTEGKSQKEAKLRIARDPGMTDVVYDSGMREDLDSLSFVPEFILAPCTRYWWDISLAADNGDRGQSESAWFETGKLDAPWQRTWICGQEGESCRFRKELAIRGEVASARIYATALGVYELYLDGNKVGDELLAPFYNDYNTWIQVQTYDVTESLAPGSHQLEAFTGAGWYMGRFGLGGKVNLFGDRQALLAELHITYKDGSSQVITTDDTWQVSPSKVRFANIYDGEVYDDTFDDGQFQQAKPYTYSGKAALTDRLSPPLRVTERITPKEIITTPAGETVLDLGQEITGYLECVINAPKGHRVKLSYFEILQQGNYYRDNLRSAQEEQIYISGGEKVVLRPHFTFFGFRYVKLEGFENPKLADFTGCVVHSDIPITSSFTSSNEKVNRLAKNALWGQRGNFLDVPTDCPQRDERMGWTGDAQAFAGTACFQMECAAFYRKYLYDMYQEQQKRNGAVPHVVPTVGLEGEASCAWADAAAVIPWTSYLFYGDPELLRREYPNMRDWVEWVYRTDEASGGRRLWDVGFHYADWLALDTKDGSPMGGTDPYFIATAYYYYSTTLVWKAAKALGLSEDTARYEKLRGEIFDAIQREYFTPAGRLAQTTQTAYVCALFMGFSEPWQEPLLSKLLEREFTQSNGKLRTGFVGTAYLNRALSMAGLNDLAYRLLTNEEYPGWLYEVNMGATTVWERWNSVLPDGSISDTGMNSLNHYAYGAVMEWVYRDVAGLNPVEEAPGFRKALLRPRPNRLLPEIRFVFDSPLGTYESAWQIQGDTFSWEVAVPFGATAKAVFPAGDMKTLGEGYPHITFSEGEEGVYAWLPAGRYTLAYPVGQDAF